jgi:hypothetical protein
MVRGMSDESRNENVTGGPAPDKDANLGELGDAAHPFDQTNGLIDGLEGESDGEAEESPSDSAEARDTGRDDGTIVPPVLPAGR